MHSDEKRSIIDAHVHLYDHRENQYPFLEQVDPMFESLIGEYSALPRRYLLDDYLADEAPLEIAGIVWHEFLSTNPLQEVRWAQRLAAGSKIPMSLVALVDFLAPDLETTLEAYAACPNISAVREHLGWDQDRPMRRFAKRRDLLSNPQWRRGLRLLRGRRFKCSLEVFSPQLADLLPVIQENSEVGFTIAVMGWPSQIDAEGFAHWKASLADLRGYENVRITISGLECIFGMNWTVAQAQLWVHTVFDLFGTDRTMFGSHRPISRLATHVPSPHIAYEKMADCLSPSEQHAVFQRNAADWFFGELKSSNFRNPFTLS